MDESRSQASKILHISFGIPVVLVPTRFNRELEINRCGERMSAMERADPLNYPRSSHGHLLQTGEAPLPS